METSKHMINGDKYMEEANIELSKANWWFNRINYNKVIELMKKAGVSFALIPDYIKSTTIYLKSLQLIINTPKLDINYGIMYELTISYLKICNEGKIQIDNSIIDFINNKIINFLQETETFPLINDLFHELIINYETFNNITESLKYCQESIRYEKLNYNITGVCIIFKKMAELNIKINQYTIASNNYKDCITIMVKNPLLIYSVRYYMLYSLILLLDEIAEQQMSEQINDYIKVYPMFSNSYEYSLLKRLIHSYKIKNVDSFQDAINNYPGTLDTHIIKVLEQFKNNMSN